MSITLRSFSVDVAPEMPLYKVLQSQSYGEETALAEFVDNAIQSFKDKYSTDLPPVLVPNLDEISILHYSV